MSQSSRRPDRWRPLEASLSEALGPEVEHPGVLLRRWLADHDETQANFSRRTGINTVNLNQILAGDKGIGTATALVLEDATRIPAETWRWMQERFEIRRARIERMERPVHPVRARQVDDGSWEWSTGDPPITGDADDIGDVALAAARALARRLATSPDAITVKIEVVE